MAIILTIV